MLSFMFKILVVSPYIFKDLVEPFLHLQRLDGLLLRCLDNEEAAKALEEAHSRICGARQSGPKLHFQI